MEEGPELGAESSSGLTFQFGWEDVQVAVPYAEMSEAEVTLAEKEGWTLVEAEVDAIVAALERAKG